MNGAVASVFVFKIMATIWSIFSEYSYILLKMLIFLMYEDSGPNKSNRDAVAENAKRSTDCSSEQRM
jgi:hypothetical protein